MRSLVRQLAAFIVAFLGALALLGVVASLSQAALARSASVPAARIAEQAGASLLPAVLIASLAAALFARVRGSSLAVAAAAIVALAAGRALLKPADGPPRPAEAARADTLVAPREMLETADTGVWLYAGEVVGTDRLRDLAFISTSAPSAPRLSYAAEARIGRDLRVGPYRLKAEPVRLTLLAADESIRSIAADLALLQERVRGSRAGGEPAAALAGVLLSFAGVAVLVRRSRWPLAGWSAALLVARGLLIGYRLAAGAQAQAFASRYLGANAPVAPTACLLLIGLILVASDLILRSRQGTRRGARLV